MWVYHKKQYIDALDRVSHSGGVVCEIVDSFIWNEIIERRTGKTKDLWFRKNNY